jgi:DNA-binding response OmpR family regulator
MLLDCGTYRIARGGRCESFPPLTFRLVTGLLAASGHWLSRDEIIDRLYGDCEDGGPLDPHGVIKVSVHRQRALLAGLGIDLLAMKKIGWRCEILPMPGQKDVGVAA